MAPGRLGAEVHPHQRHRQRGQDDPPRHLLPDERQLLLRGLLQGGRHRPGLGPADLARRRRRLRARRRPPVDDHLGGGRGLLRPLDPRRRPAGRPHPEAPLQGHLLVHRPARAGRLLLRDPLRPRSRLRPGRRPGRRRAGGPLPGDLEPRLRRVRQGRGRGPRLRTGRQARPDRHRHRRRPGAHRLPPPGQSQHVRDRRGLPRHRGDRGDHREEIRGRRPGRRAHARGGRPRPLCPHAHRRRRTPRQRRPRIRPAAAHPAGRALRPPPGRGRGGAHRTRDGLQGRHVRVLPGAGGRRRPDPPGGGRGGGGLPAHSGRRHPDLRPRRLHSL